ncbi:MAG TPA: hypothetical protein VJT71_13200 [Pyrinomonadaceae bacterium]|nr:hypothetical protein [Pyrinomonadaceae bacterium]
MIRWIKQGLIFRAAAQHSWMQSHTAVAIPLRMSGDRYRIYFGTRDSENHPHIGYVEIDIKTPTKVLEISDQYVLGPGPRGCFDDNGVYPGCIVEDNGKLLMYYIGRSNGEPPLYYMSIGLAVSEDGGKTFHRLYKAPLMSRSEFDPWMVSTPFVMKEQGRWRMWYLSGLGWEGRRSYYHIKYAASEDGLSWVRDGQVCIDFRATETNIASPCVVKDKGLYQMWYSYVIGNEGYRIGYAESADGLSWARKDDQAGIEPSASGWDSQGMSYPFVIDHDGVKYLFYSGNYFGRDGMGIAVESS